ncbi:unnamed protein product [Auanema sp. JU1783]|nr:unnamed protein product [Auanema sp. JU1783]
MLFWVLIALALTTAGAEDCRDTLSQKICNLGMTFLTKAEVKKACTCIEDSFYNLNDLNDIASKGITCLMTSLSNPLKGLTALSIKSNIDKCLKGSPSGDAMGLIEKMKQPIFNNIKKVTNKLFAAIKKAKGNNKPKEFVLQKGYCLLKAAITKNFIDNTCTKCVKKQMNKQELSCVLTDAVKLVDISKYSCAKIKL